MKTLSRWDFIRMVSEKVEHRCPQTDIYFVVQAVFDCFEDVLKNGNRLSVGNIFSLQPRYKKENRTGNFGNPIIIPGHWEPHFKAYSRLKNACVELNEKIENGTENLENDNEE